MIFPFKYQVYNCPLIIFLRPASFFFTSADESTNLSWAVIVVQAKKIWFILILNNEFRYEIGNRWIHYSLPTKNQGKQIEAKEENRYNDFILLASCCLRLSNKFNQFLFKSCLGFFFTQEDPIIWLTFLIYINQKIEFILSDLFNWSIFIQID